jgi:hypothetical protein
MTTDPLHRCKFFTEIGCVDLDSDTKRFFCKTGMVDFC